MIIMGIDPGLASTGVGVVGSDGRGGWRMLYSAHVTTSLHSTLPQRLQKIHQLVLDTIRRYEPQAVAIESIFFAKNVRSAVLMAHGRGVALLAASQQGLELMEYSPLEIKQSVVGKGRANKEQVRQMIGVLLGVQDRLPASDHETDALACALCHAFRAHSGVQVAIRREEASMDPRTLAAYDARKELLASSLRRRGSRKRRARPVG